MQTAEQIMSSDVVTIGPEATLSEAIHRLLTRRVSGLPVVDDNQMLVGIITEFALLALAYDDGLQQQTVAQHMTRDVITVDVSDPVNRMADLFIVHRVRRLPVVRGGRLAGLVSRSDVLAALEQSAPICTA
ncbi:MAG: CBS domain-containing protein [Planctomycetota bacterium]